MTSKQLSSNLSAGLCVSVMSRKELILCSLLLLAQCRKRRMKVAVVGVPKTIDNDILLMDKTFGFDTAVEEAQRAINSAYIEVGPPYIESCSYWFISFSSCSCIIQVRCRFCCECSIIMYSVNFLIPHFCPGA